MKASSHELTSKKTLKTKKTDLGVHNVRNFELVFMGVELDGNLVGWKVAGFSFFWVMQEVHGIEQSSLQNVSCKSVESTPVE